MNLRPKLEKRKSSAESTQRERLSSLNNGADTPVKPPKPARLGLNNSSSKNIGVVGPRYKEDASFDPLSDKQKINFDKRLSERGIKIKVGGHQPQINSTQKSIRQSSGMRLKLPTSESKDKGLGYTSNTSQ